MSMNNKALILALYSLGSIAHAEGNLPYDVEKLINQRANAIEKNDLTYIQKLENLKTRYTKQGNLEVANTIVSLIEGRGAGLGHRPKKQDPILGVWKWPSGYHIVCLPSGKLYAFKNGRKWNLKWEFIELGNKYRFTWNHGGSTDGVIEGGKLLMISGPNEGKKISKDG